MEAPGGRRGDETPSGPRGRFQPAPGAPDLRRRRLDPAVRSGPPEVPIQGPPRPADRLDGARDAGRRTLPARPPPPHVEVAGRTSSPATGRGPVCGRFEARCVEFANALRCRAQGLDFV